MIVPNAPGSSVDTLSRIIAGKLSEVLGQQVISDNRAGAGGVIGMEIAKAAIPDGYTLISATTAASTIAVLLQKKPTYDPVNDYDHVVQFAVTPNVLVVNPALPVKSVRELIDYCKAKQGQVNMASAGPGSQSHLSGAYFMQAAKFESLHVPYKGGGPSVAAVIAGESQWTLTPAAAVMSFVHSRAPARAGPQPAAALRRCWATFRRLRKPYRVSITTDGRDSWCRRARPRPIIEKLRAAIIKTANLPEVKNLLAAQGTEVVTGTSQEFRKVVQDSMAKNALVVKAVGLKLE